MKTPSTQLYDLIYSLSSSEKRYLTLHIDTKKGKDNDLAIQFLKLILKNEGKSVEEIEKKITFTKYISRLKKYLYENVMECLDDYHLNKFPTISIRKSINQIEHLYHKNLYDKCIVLVKQNLKQAEQIDHQALKIELYSWYIKIVGAIEDKQSLKILKDLLLKKENSTSKLDIENKYQKLHVSIFGYTEQLGSLYSKKGHQKLKEMMDHPLLMNNSIPTSFYSKKIFNLIYYNYYKYINDHEKSIYHIKKNLALYNDYPLRKEMEQEGYLSCLNSCAISMIMNQNYEEAESYFLKMEEIVPKTLQIEIKIFEFFSSNRLGLYLKLEDL